MNALAHKLHEIAIVLENEATFHEMYKACAGESHARARTVIMQFAKLTSPEAIEKVRPYHTLGREVLGLEA